MSKSVFFAALLLAGCSEPIATDVAVGTSAASKWAEIQDAVDVMNDMIGEDVFTIGPSTGNGVVDGYITVTMEKNLGKNGRLDVVGRTVTHTVRGDVLVKIVPGSNSLHIAHELGHAAGLEHVDDPENLMYYASTKWQLNEDQIEYLRSLL